MKSAYDSLKDKGSELMNAIGKIWDDVLTTISSQFTKLKTYLIKTEQEAKEWFENNKELFIETSKSLKQSTIGWLRDMGEDLANIYTKVKNGTINVLKIFGKVSFIIVMSPIVLLYMGIKRIPDLYQASQNWVENGMEQLGEYWEKQKSEMGEEYVSGFNKGMSKTGVPTGKIPVRNSVTGKYEPASESRILKFSDFVNEKKKHMSKEEFLEMIGKGKKKKDKCKECGKGKCECE